MSLKLITESQFEGVEYTEEICEATSKKSMFIEGITLQANVKNRNNRIYPVDVLDEAVTTYLNETSQLGMTMEGELKHPKSNSGEVNEDRISHRFVDVRKDGDNWYTKALILDTPQGMQVRNLMEGGVKLGISSRCLGQMKEQDEVSVVQPGLKVVTLGDVVRRPSSPDALITAIRENKEWVYENGVLVEKDIEEELDEYKKLIAETTKKDRANVFASILTDYFKKIKF